MQCWWYAHTDIEISLNKLWSSLRPVCFVTFVSIVNMCCLVSLANSNIKGVESVETAL